MDDEYDSDEHKMLLDARRSFDKNMCFFFSRFIYVPVRVRVRVSVELLLNG